MRKFMNFKTLGILMLFFVGTFMACSELPETDLENSEDLNGSGNGKGTVVFKITDAPFPADLVAEANITIDWIKLLKSSDDAEEGEEENGGEEGENSSDVLIQLEEAVTYNLIELSNGQTAIMAEMEIPSGVYKEIRLHVIDAGIVLKDGSEYDLKVPSGNSSGLKIKVEPALEVEDGVNSEVLFDFDVSRSFVMRGNLKNLQGFIFKPVVRAVAHGQTTTGEINGIVSDSEENPVENASLYLIAGEDTITSALSNEAGFYAIIGIPAGDYILSLNFNDDEYVENVDVSVEAGAITEQNFVIGGDGQQDDEEVGTITGLVSDTAQVIIENALISLIVDEDTITTTLTGADGLYSLTGVVPGDYLVACEAAGFVDQSANVTVEADGEAVQNFELVPEETDNQGGDDE